MHKEETRWIGNSKVMATKDTAKKVRGENVCNHEFTCLAAICTLFPLSKAKAPLSQELGTCEFC